MAGGGGRGERRGGGGRAWQSNARKNEILEWIKGRRMRRMGKKERQTTVGKSGREQSDSGKQEEGKTEGEN